MAHVPAGGGSLTVLSFPRDAGGQPAGVHGAGTRGPAPTPTEIVPAAARAPLRLGVRRRRPAVRHPGRAAAERHRDHRLPRHRREPDRARSRTPLGGVAVCVPRPVDDGVLGAVVPQPGRTTLDGRRAADYATAAAVAGDPPSGRARIERQQLAARRRCLQQALGGRGPARHGAARPAAPGARPGRSSPTAVDLDRMLALGRSLQNLEADGVTFAAVPTAARPARRGDPARRRRVHVFAAVRADRPLPAGVDGGDNPS